MNNSRMTLGLITGSKTATALAGGLCLSAGTALAGPVNLNNVPADARTIIHVDIEAATSSIIGQFILENGDKLGIDKLDDIRQVEQEIGLDPLEDVYDVTVVIEDNDVDVIIATTSGEVDDALEAIQDKLGESFETVRAGGHKMISIRDGGELMFIWIESSGRKRTIVAGRDAERVADVVSLTEGDGESLADSSSALAKVKAQDGTIVFAATLDAAKFAKHSLVSALLHESSAVVVQVGEDDGEAFGQVTLGVGSDKAEKIAKMAAGLVAFGQLMTENEDIASEIKNARVKMLSALDFDSNRGNVQVSFRYDVEKFIGLLQEAHGDRE